MLFMLNILPAVLIVAAVMFAVCTAAEMFGASQRPKRSRLRRRPTSPDAKWIEGKGWIVPGTGTADDWMAAVRDWQPRSKTVAEGLERALLADDWTAADGLPNAERRAIQSARHAYVHSTAPDAIVDFEARVAEILNPPDVESLNPADAVAALRASTEEQLRRLYSTPQTNAGRMMVLAEGGRPEKVILRCSDCECVRSLGGEYSFFCSGRCRAVPVPDCRSGLDGVSRCTCPKCDQITVDGSDEVY